MPEPRLLVAVGSYTGDRGHGNGLTTYWLQDKGRGMSSQQRIAMDSPSYLAWHPDLAVLYAVQERAGGALTAFAADREGTLHRLGTLPTGGDDPCHVSISPDGRRAYCSNYTSGSLAVVELAPDGAPRERVALVQHHGSGHDPQRQESPHVHMAVTADDAGRGGRPRPGPGVRL